MNRLLALLLLPAPVVAADTIEVEILDVKVHEYVYGLHSPGGINAMSNTSCVGSTCSTHTTGSVSPATSYEYSLHGATFTMRLPDGRQVIARCAPSGGIVTFHHGCKHPRNDRVQADFKRKKVKLSWPVSLDGRKLESETYNVLSIQEP